MPYGGWGHVSSAIGALSDGLNYFSMPLHYAAMFASIAGSQRILVVSPSSFVSASSINAQGVTSFEPDGSQNAAWQWVGPETVAKEFLIPYGYAESFRNGTQFTNSNVATME